ncbi:hypothetical protein [Leisingera sp. M523]|uniref:hypothetical protein n=1 Tax=Leisingera sp. M523 TaxID=2867013 RepID=UPI0021A85735|nr:hypothetical protein [Leisingera sp. M523]UWQ30242.1 hypothetical protein K3557_06815 [Leisingera sp. M523]
MDYTEFTPKGRFALVDRMACQLFESERWETEFANRYGLSRQAVGKWAHEGAPVWACVALRDALAAKALQAIRGQISDVLDLMPGGEAGDLPTG